jgi:hypothetical protein
MTDIPGPPPGGPEDDQALQEATFFQRRDDPPELIAARTRYRIALVEIKHVFLKAVKIVVFLLPFVGFVMLLVWLDHIIGPQSWRWLSADEVNHLQSLLFSGAISALATAIATKNV